MNFEQISKSLKDTKILLDLPYESFLNMVSREDLYVSSEDPVLDLVVKYITDREAALDKNPVVPLVPVAGQQNNAAPNKQAPPPN